MLMKLPVKILIELTEMLVYKTHTHTHILILIGHTHRKLGYKISKTSG